MIVALSNGATIHREPVSFLTTLMEEIPSGIIRSEKCVGEPLPATGTILGRASTVVQLIFV